MKIGNSVRLVCASGSEKDVNRAQSGNESLQTIDLSKTEGKYCGKTMTKDKKTFYRKCRAKDLEFLK